MVNQGPPFTAQASISAVAGGVKLNQPIISTVTTAPQAMMQQQQQQVPPTQQQQPVPVPNQQPQAPPQQQPTPNQAPAPSQPNMVRRRRHLVQMVALLLSHSDIDHYVQKRAD